MRNPGSRPAQRHAPRPCRGHRLLRKDGRMAAGQFPRTLPICTLGACPQEGQEVGHVPVPPKLRTVDDHRRVSLPLSGFLDFRVRVLGGDAGL